MPAEKSSKAEDDIDQAGDLVEALAMGRLHVDLGLTLFEAMGRGTWWRRRILMAAFRLSDERLDILRSAVEAAGQLENWDREETGLTGGREGIRRRLSGRSKPPTGAYAVAPPGRGTIVNEKLGDAIASRLSPLTASTV